MNKVVWCDRGFYPVFIGFCPSARAWNAEMKRLNVVEPYPAISGARCSTFESPNGNMVILVSVADAVDKLKDKASVVALILHEAVHVWQRIRDDIGERSPSHECEAYAVQGIAQDLLSAYCKTRRKLL